MVIAARVTFAASASCAGVASVGHGWIISTCRVLKSCSVKSSSIRAKAAASARSIQRRMCFIRTRAPSTSGANFGSSFQNDAHRATC